MEMFVNNSGFCLSQHLCKLFFALLGDAFGALELFEQLLLCNGTDSLYIIELRVYLPFLTKRAMECDSKPMGLISELHDEFE